MKLRPVAVGLLTFIPGISKLLKSRGTGGTNSASYCYNVWLKHLTILWENGLYSMPNTLAEIGPGDSIGIGLASLLSGVNHYYSLDVVKYANTDKNLKILDELIEMFKTREGRFPKGWPDHDRYLDKNLFPSHILTDELLKKTLSDERVSLIRKALVSPYSHNKEISIKYVVPWADESVIEKETIDLILSHSVLEHVIDLEATYRAFYQWLKPKGMMSHSIDFRSHRLTEKWNGHRCCSEFIWKVIVGKRPFLINRQPCSIHINYLKKNSFKIVYHLKNYQPNGIQRAELSSYWENISDDDLSCSGTFVQAQKE